MLPITTPQSPLGQALGGTQTAALPSSAPVALGALFAVPKEASSARLQVVGVGAGNLPVSYRLDGNVASSAGLLLPGLAVLPLSNKQELQRCVLSAAENGVIIAVQFFSSLVQP